MSYQLLRTAAFIRTAQKAVRKDPDLAEDIRQALEWLSQDVYDARLKTHKLKGPLAGIWACAAGYDTRILFKRVEKDGGSAILLLAVGTHDEVY